jgi:predicted acetyltransferase
MFRIAGAVGLLLTAALAGCGGGTSDTDLSNIILERSRAYAAAAVREDLDAVMELYSEGYKDGEGNRKAHIREQLTQTFARMDILTFEYLDERMSANEMSDRVMHTFRSRIRARDRATGEDLAREIWMSQEWEQEGGVWRLKTSRRRKSPGAPDPFPQP